jgi:CubicO group peptidase (beta-lactamase class C family)
MALEASVEAIENRISESAAKTGSDEVLIWRNGREVYHYHSCEAPAVFDIKEMTGLFYSLAVGKLIEQKKVSYLDVQISDILKNYPSETTLRQLLNHTSALSKKKDLLLLEQVIEELSGKTISKYIEEEFFLPLGIKSGTWITEEGNLSLLLSAQDLAKVGWVLANQGMSHCKQLISPEWLAILKKPSQNDNPFWGQQLWLEHRDIAIYWDESLLKDYWKARMSQYPLAKFAALEGREVHFGGSAVQGNILRLWGRELCPDRYQLIELIVESYFKSMPLGRFTPGPLKALIGWGGLGQQLIVFPDEKIVAVRLAVKPKEPFLEFIYEVDALSKEYVEISHSR